jgi:hypothetical protein
VIAGDRDDRAVLGGRRHPERVALALDNEHRDVHLVELRQAARFRAPWRMHRKREAEYCDGADCFRGAAGDARSEGPAADHERQTLQFTRPEVIDDGRPGSVELPCRSRAAATRNAIGLLDERDTQAL